MESASRARFVVPHLREPVGFHLLVDGRYEAQTDDFIAGQLSAGSVFVDVGANIGVFTVSAGQVVGPQGRVLALEASPSVFPYLERNVALNGLSNVTPIQVAVSDRNCERAEFYPAPVDRFGMGALAPQFGAEPCAVRTAKLDDLVLAYVPDRVGLLKVDVEGHELAVFLGARDLLTRSPSPVIVFEFCDWAEGRFPHTRPGDAQRHLMDLGYRIWRLKDFMRRRQPLGAALTSGSEMLVATRDTTR